MKKRPSGLKYRNLARRGRVIYYERLVGGRRVVFSTKTDDWDIAAAVRAEYEAQRGVEDLPPVIQRSPRFRDFARRYLDEDIGHLSTSEQEDRKRFLKPEGELVAWFGDFDLSEIGRRHLMEWWTARIVQGERTTKTGRNYLDALAGLFRYAEDLELVDESPTNAFRRSLRRRGATKSARAAKGPSEAITPFGADDLASFMQASTEAAGAGHLVDVLLLDAGLRMGEAHGIRWGDVWWGRGARDATRSLRIAVSVARGRYEGRTKSGRERRVQLSRRLLILLREEWLRRGQPTGDERVLEAFEPSEYRTGHFASVCTAAKIGHRRPKDLRDTFASHLLSAGFQLAYVSAQLGHGDVAVTARHYARWVESDRYVEPPRLQEGDVPADVLASPTTPNRVPSPVVATLAASASPETRKPQKSEDF